MIGYGFNQSNSIDIYKVLGDKIVPIADKLHHLEINRKRFLLMYFSTTIAIDITGYLLVPIVLPKYAQAINYFIILSIYGFFGCVSLV